MDDAIDFDEAVDELFTTPLEDFVAARNALVKTLKAVGMKDAAADIATLRKPNRLVWAMNQLALTDDPALPPLLEAAYEVRDGLGDLKPAMAGLRLAVNTAAAAAARRLDPRPTDRADLAAALLAVVADHYTADDLAQGRVLKLSAPDAFGFGLTEPSPKPAKPKAAPKAKAAVKAGDRPPDQLAIRRATKRQREAAKEADAAARALARAGKTADKADSALAEVGEEVARADTARTAAEAALERAHGDVEQAEAAAADALDAQQRAAGLLGEARQRAAAAAAELEVATAALAALGG